MKKLILCVEDDLDILENNRKALFDNGYSVLTAENLKQARERLSDSAPDAIVLDIMLPDGIGLDFLKELRESGCKIPVLLLTAWDKPSDVARGLKLGANDYLSKPFDYEELLARVEAMFRNAEQIPDAIRKERLTLKVRSMEVCFGNKKIRLPSMEFFLLQLFMENEDKDLKSEYIYEQIWGSDMMDDPAPVRKAISRLRQKIEGSGYTVTSVYGGVYRFEREQ